MLPILTRKAEQDAAADEESAGHRRLVLRAFRDRPPPALADVDNDDGDGNGNGKAARLRSAAALRTSGEQEALRPVLANYNLILDNVSFGRDAKNRQPPIFRNASALLPIGRRVAVLGNKGAGKTTLVNLIAGVLSPDSGTVYVNRRVSWPFGFNKMLTASMSFRSNVVFFAGLLNLDVGRTVDFVAHFSGLHAHDKRPIKEIEMAARRDLAVALSIAANHECYLIDGNLPLNNMAGWKGEFVRQFLLTKDVIFVTSKASQARELCDVAGVIEDQRIRFYDDFDVAEWRLAASPTYGRSAGREEEDEAEDAELII